MMANNFKMAYKVAVVKWAHADEIAEAICCELCELGHCPVPFRFDQPIPRDAEVVISFAPYGRLLQIPRQLENFPKEKRPAYIHWNTESLPDFRIPWLLINTISCCRSWVDQLNDSAHAPVRILTKIPPLSWIDRRMFRYRYIGDYQLAQRMGWMSVLAEISEIYAQAHRHLGLSSVVIPWGTPQGWYADLKLERDIDVLWLGKRRTKRRSDLIDHLRHELSLHNIQMQVVDNVETPFVFGRERTRLLNRAKITLNLLSARSDNLFSHRFHLAASNRSLVVSEPLLPHCPQYEAGHHYISTPVEALAETIAFYLKNEDQRLRIAENAYQLAATQLTMGNSTKALMAAVDSALLVKYDSLPVRTSLPLPASSLTLPPTFP